MDVFKQIAETFGVEWPKFLAQLILFIVVYLILSKYAFGPIVAMLEERRRIIEEGQLNAEKIKKQLAESEARHAEILNKANEQAQKMIDEARASSQTLADRKQQQAITEAEQIISKARDTATIERDKLMTELKREVGRLVVDTTARVTGKILTSEDQRRISEEAARQAAV